VAPRGTPKPIVDKIHAEVVKILTDPAVKEKSERTGNYPVTSTPLHPQGGGALGKGDQGNRHQGRVRKDAMHARAIALALLAVLTGAAAAQERPEAFPSRSIKIVVPFPAGGPSDVLARLIGQKMSEDWGQPVVIENRPGANTVIGAQLVAKAAPDGYTLLMAIDSTLTMNQYLYRTPPYDPFNDFAPITLVGKTLQILMVNSQSEVKTVNELIAKAKAQPGKLNYGAGTITTRLTGFLFNKAAGVNTVLVPYNGSAEVTQGLLTKSVDFTFDGTSAAASLIQGGQFRVLAKFDRRPFPPVPDVPNIQAALPDLDEISVWLGLVAPKGTPSPVIDKLQAEVAKVLADPAVKAKADASGLFPATSTPAEFSAFIRKEAERWSAVVKESGMRYD
jgi:tripartite-type tricarboxylate transporter receptor subunit TctC